MLVSLSWLNSYLSQSVSLDAATRALIEAGFPVESTEPLPRNDHRLDVEITSNRGDCLCVLGLAREIAAQEPNGLTLIPPGNPAAAADPTPASSLLELHNQNPEVCPRFTVRIIRGVKVGPSPDWLRERLESVGQRSINNVVDITNFANFELGHPCHAFDLAKLGKSASGKPVITVRFARDKEELTTLDGKKRVLRSDELVVADASRAQGLAGVMGGHDSEVDAGTTDIALEVATWDPVTVRRASRRHQLRTDASHRYERVVDPRTIDAAAVRIAALLAHTCGGKLCAGTLEAGSKVPSPTQIALRPARCRAILGVEVSATDVASRLAPLGIECSPIGRGGEELLCTVPAGRPDLTREIDIIEEIARVTGLGAVPMHPKIPVAIRPPQSSELARREIGSLLAGMGFFEAVTFSFCTRKQAEMFMPAGLRSVEVDDERRRDSPVLRPGVLCGLLSSRAANQNSQVTHEGGIRLFETAAVFAQQPGAPGALPQSVEQMRLAMLLDTPRSGKSATTGELQSGIRCLRAAIESIVRAMWGSRAVSGADASLRFTPSAPHCPAFDPKAYAAIELGGRQLGHIGLLSPAALAWDLASPVCGAELDHDLLISGYPPRVKLDSLPAFPGIERDVSLIVSEAVTWSEVERVIGAGRDGKLEGASFVGVYRGAQIGKGRKSMTVRFHFRDPTRTLRHDEIDAPVARLVESLKSAVKAEIRA